MFFCFLNRDVGAGINLFIVLVCVKSACCSYATNGNNRLNLLLFRTLPFFPSPLLLQAHSFEWISQPWRRCDEACISFSACIGLIFKQLWGQEGALQGRGQGMVLGRRFYRILVCSRTYTLSPCRYWEGPSWHSPSERWRWAARYRLSSTEGAGFIFFFFDIWYLIFLWARSKERWRDHAHLSFSVVASFGLWYPVWAWLQDWVSSAQSWMTSSQSCGAG